MRAQATAVAQRAPVQPVAPLSAGRAPLLQRKCACGGSAGFSGECEECKTATLQRKRNARHGPGEKANVAPHIVHEVLNSPGHPLDAGIRALFESRFGHDFSRVRVHNDTKAAESARAVDAQAYTVGRDVVFDTDRYAPHSMGGSKLLAHELAHTMQQNQADHRSISSIPLGSVDDAAERHAEAYAHAASDTASVSVPGAIGRVDSLNQAGSRTVLRRYGHANDCDQKKYLEPFIWPGHDHAKKCVARAISELGKTPLHPTAKRELVRLFGPGAEAQVGTIAANFSTIASALTQQYLYHCANPCTGKDKGARAWTEPSGNKDITICFDQVSGFSVPAAAWIIIHENVHRGLNVWPVPHPWQPKDFDACIGIAGASAPGFATVKLDNPDSYACFASLMWFPLGTP
jgi:Domain of unknown function (DUF4157)